MVLNYFSIFSNRAFLSVAIFATILIAATLIVLEMNVRTVSYSNRGVSVSASSALPVTGVPVAYAGTTSQTRGPIMREFHIANTGLVLVRGATVLSVDEDSLVVGITWGAANFTWRVHADNGTKFVSSSGTKSQLSDLRVGDVVVVTGMLTENGGTPKIDADFVRNE